MDARKALKESYRKYAEAAEAAKKDAKDLNPMLSEDMLKVQTQLISWVSVEEDHLRPLSWDDVKEAVPQCVAFVPGFSSIKDKVETTFAGIVDYAEKLSPTYISPPPFV